MTQAASGRVGVDQARLEVNSPAAALESSGTGSRYVSSGPPQFQISMQMRRQGPAFHELRESRGPLCGCEMGLGYPPRLASKSAGARIGRDSDKARMSWSPLTRIDALLSASAIR